MPLSKEQLIIIGLGVAYYQSSNNRLKRKKWAKEWLTKRSKYTHINILNELRDHPDDWRNYMRMSEDCYKTLLELLTPRIQKQDTELRDAISPHERLSATLRFLATGRKYEDLKFSVIISPQALSSIIPDVCAAIIQVLDNIKFPKTEAEWMATAREFEEKWNFPNCLGAVDGKHIRIKPPPGCGSYYYNYKSTHSIVLMAIANANYEFIMVDCGTNGRVSDGGVLEKTLFYKKFKENKLRIPPPRAPDGTDISLPYVFVGDEAFAMHVNFLKPFGQRQLTEERRIYNYRLSRSRRIVENTFGILANRFQVLQSVINLRIDRIGVIVMACCALHNFLRQHSASSAYLEAQCLDSENLDNGTISRGLRTDPEAMHSLKLRQFNGSAAAKESRNKYLTYFNTDGQVPWQRNMI